MSPGVLERSLRPFGQTLTRLRIAGSLLCVSLISCATPPTVTAEAPAGVAGRQIVAMRRLTEAQYRNSIADIFGPGITVGGRFETISRPDHGLIASGAAGSSVSAAGFEQYDSIARSIAGQVFGPKNRATFISCAPKDPRKADPACARAVYANMGRLIIRRPLTRQELDRYVDRAGQGAEVTHDFYTGLSLGLASMLVSPQFLYRIEAKAPGSDHLDGYAKATRLSYLLWNSTPDDALLRAAQRGDLNSPQGQQAQVDRMMASPRVEQGVRAFFSDFLGLDRMADINKDPVIYGRFNAQVGADLPEQTLRTIVDLLVTSNRPYPELFTTRRTFINRRLAVLYSAPFAGSDGWEAYQIPEGDERVGLLGLGAFLALHSHEGRSSPTLRGKAIREVLFCQPVPPPPPNVDFAGFEDTGNAVLKTARQRMDRHNTDPVCAACHKITDPIGLPLERFDGIGALRSTENGAVIDTSGEFEGAAFRGLEGLSPLLAKSEAPTTCVANRLVEYATGRQMDAIPAGWSKIAMDRFQSDGLRFTALLRAVAENPEFYSTRASETEPSHVAYLNHLQSRKMEKR